MADHDISTSAVTWPSPTQYIETEIATGASGDTYRLLSGVHRMQHVQSLLTDDILELAPGAVLNGAEDFGTSGWTAASTEWWKTPPSTLSRVSVHGLTGNCLTGYECGRLEWIVIDDEPKAFVTTQGAVNADSAYYDSGADRVYIGIDPSTVSTIEISRQVRAISNNTAASDVTIRAQDKATPGVIKNYASDAEWNRAAVGLGVSPGGSNSGTGWICEDIEIRNMQGGAVGLGNSARMTRCSVHRIGQLGYGDASNSDPIVEYCDGYLAGIGGWVAGWEAGNTKFVAQTRGVLRGCHFYIIAHTNLSAVSPLWYDIDNDGCEVHSTLVADYSAAGIDRRGLFYEISWSGNLHHNTLYNLNRDSENQGWAKSVISSESGPTSAVSHELASLFFEDNHIYMCWGGPGGVENGPRNSWLVRRMEVNRNVVHLDDENATWTPQTGIQDWNGTSDPHTCAFEDNLYYVPNAATGHWLNEQTGGSSGSLTFAQWQTDGQDANGQVATERTHPSGDPNPISGGCLSM